MIEFKNLNKIYGEEVILQNFSINFEEKKVNCIIGKSGVGKTTILKMISGILKNDVQKINKNIKEVSYVFQEDRLIEWLDVEKNISIVVKNKFAKEEIKSKCIEIMKQLGILKYKNYYPRELSGGLRQRVNIARAFIYPSELVILDEPFKSIDVKNKQVVMDMIKNIISKKNNTIILVTHNIEEVLALSDNITVVGKRPLQIIANLKNNKEITKDILEKLI